MLANLIHMLVGCVESLILIPVVVLRILRPVRQDHGHVEAARHQRDVEDQAIEASLSALARLTELPRRRRTVRVGVVRFCGLNVTPGSSVKVVVRSLRKSSRRLVVFLVAELIATLLATSALLAASESLEDIVREGISHVPDRECGESDTDPQRRLIVV